MILATALVAGMAWADLPMPSGFAGADVLVLGEVHDHPLHHQIQAAVVAEVAPTAIVFEMLSPDQAAGAVGLEGPSPEALAAALDWSAGGWPDFSLYAPIFATAPEAAIVGAALAPDLVRQAVSAGAAAVFPGDGARFGLDQPLDPDEQAAREALQLAAHCDALPAVMLPGMVEAQRLRDGAFAAATLAALETYGAPVVVITGWGHAQRNWGMTRHLDAALPGRVYALGLIERGATGAVTWRFDEVIETDPVDRPDPCVVFRDPPHQSEGAE